MLGIGALSRAKKRLALFTGIEWQIKRLGPHSSVHVQVLRLARHFGIATVIDVGANIGQFAEGLLDYGFEGRVISFEPIERVHRVLVRRAARYPNWSVYRPCALGQEEGAAEINVSEATVFSSLLEVEERHAEAKPSSRIVDTQRVEVRTLDSLLGELDIVPERTLLKIDTQGFERDVLLGGRQLIADGLKGVKTEMPLFPIYRGTPWVFDDIYGFLRNQGYRLYALNREGVDPGSGRTNTLDGVFFRE